MNLNDKFTHVNFSFFFLYLDPGTGQLDCNATSFGSLSWLTGNPNYRNYLSNAKCADDTPLESITAAAVNGAVLGSSGGIAKCVCPWPDLISPCSCAASTSYNGTVDVVCTGNAITDCRMQEIIASIPAKLPIGKLDLSGTGIAQIPSGLTKLTIISELSLAGNQIIAVNNGALAVNSSTLMKLDLSGNAKLATIGNSSLPSKSTNQCKYLEV